MRFSIISLWPRTAINRLICLCTVANLINSADRVIMPIAIIPMANQFGWSIHWQGWILSSFAIGYITSQMIVSNVASRYGSGNVLTISIFFWSLSTLITPMIASNIYLFIVFRILLGLGEGLGLPMIYQLFAANVPISQRSRAFGYLISAGTVGQTISALVTSHIYWPIMFYTMGTLGMFWLIFWIRFFHRTNHLVDDHLISSSSSSCVNSGDLEAPLMNEDVSKNNTIRNNRFHVHWSEWITRWSLWAIYLAHFAMNWSSYIIMQWLPYYLSRYLSADQKSLSLTALPYIMNSMAGIGAGHMADNLITERKWSILSVRRLMTGLGLFGAGICMLLFCSLKSLWLAIVIICMAMSFCALNAAGHLSNHTDVAPNHAGVTFAISNTIATIPGLLCGPLTAELVTQSHGRWLPVFVLASAINFVGAIIYVSQSSASPLF